MTKVVAFLPVKGTSERIGNKNTKLLNGKELFMHTLEKLTKCDFIDEVYLDSESEDIFQIASEVNCKKLKRDPSLANNKTDGNKLFMNQVNQIEADIYIQILCTSPFIDIDTIRKGVDAIKNNDSYDSAVLVKKEKTYPWDENGPLYDRENIPNSKDLPDTITETMGLYIIKKQAAISTQRRLGNSPYLIESSAIEAVDVNYLEDFELAELIQSGKKRKENEYFNILKKHLSSAILSDIFDDLKIKGIIKGLKPNFPTNILGRAKTLKIRKLEENEDYRGIYSALNSYNHIQENDVIVVENAISDYAYFGEMNANLAIRSGASAAIIGGKTRDTNEVLNLKFPTFSAGSTCSDVRKRATMESMNKKIIINGITIFPDDLIFADSDGIAIIPKGYEDKVLELALKTINTEKNIVKDILNKYDTNEIIKKNGFF